LLLLQQQLFYKLLPCGIVLRKVSTMMIEVKLNQPLKVNSADDEIITMAGWELGIVTPGKPLHVLHVEPGASIAAHGVQSNDLLISIDGTNVVSIPKNDITKALEAASRLNFERTEMADDEAEADFEAKDPMDIDLGDALEPGADAAASAPTAQATTPGDAEGSGDTITPDSSNAAAASSTDGSALKTGMQVKLKGISESMNGKHGRLGKFSDKTGCWQVFLENTSAAKAVRPQNLELMLGTEPDPEPPGASSATTPASANVTTADGQPPASSNGTGAVRPPIAARQMAARSLVPDLPMDHDMDAWVELLRDAHIRQLRSDNEYPEPPPFDQANRYGVSHGQTVPEGHFPSQALKQQQQMLHRSYHGEGTKPGMIMMGGNMGMMGQIGNMMNMMGMMPRRGGRGAGPARFMSPYSSGGMM